MVCFYLKHILAIKVVALSLKGHRVGRCNTVTAYNNNFIKMQFECTYPNLQHNYVKTHFIAINAVMKHEKVSCPLAGCFACVWVKLMMVLFFPQYYGKYYSAC